MPSKRAKYTHLNCRIVASAVVLLSFVATLAHAADETSSDPANTDVGVRKAGVGPLPESFEFIAFPIVAYTPETSVLFAGAGLFFFTLGDGPDAARSDLLINAAYSLRGQAAVQIKPNLAFGDGANALEAEVVFLDWPSDFFGLGADNEEVAEEFNNFQFETEFIYHRRLAENLTIGLAYEIGYNNLTYDPDSTYFDPDTTPGYDGGWLSGIGARAKYDTRDTKFAATTGMYNAAEATHYSQALGSAYDYWKLRWDSRIFRSWKEHVIGLQAVTRLTFGDTVPFYDQSTIGGHRQLRGVYKMRNLDRHMFVLQSEYRTPYIWRIGLAGFAGMGATFADVAELDTESINWGVGAGVRVLLMKSQKVNLRMDFGVSNDDFGFYFGLSEAF